MCFSIPYRVISISDNTVEVEGGKRITIGNAFPVSKGEYLQIVGNVAIGKLSKKEGIKIRKLIKRLNKQHG